MATTERMISRRGLLVAGAGLAGLGALAACGSQAASPVGPGSPQVAAYAAAQRRPGAPRRQFLLRAGIQDVDLGGPVVRTWTHGAGLPGPLIRGTSGDEVTVRLENRLPTVPATDGDGATTLHWHGLALRNDMDGVPDVTQAPVPSGADMDYTFTLPHPGTYWYHSHVGVQFDRGLSGPLVIDDPAEPGGYDAEFLVVLDDWLDGVGGTTPDAVLAGLRRSGMRMGGDAPSAVGGDGGDVDYPYFLVNGRIPSTPSTFTARPGQRVRIRLINAAGDTTFRVALGSHRLTMTHTDGWPAVPVTGDAVLIGPAERYDLLVDLTDGAFPLVAAAEGKSGGARAVVRTSPGAAVPPFDAVPAELRGRLLTVADAVAAPSAQLVERPPDRTHTLALTADMAGYRWMINGRTFDQRIPLLVRSGERVRLAFVNQTTMYHPMHLHGHTFAVRGMGAPRKDTVLVLPGATVTVDFDADNPGQWATHCHLIYHEAAGMMTQVSYEV